MGQFGGGGNPFYVSGAGAPGSLNKPQGTIYTRTDAQGLYISAPTFVTPSIVQSAHGDAHNTGGGPTLGAPVTAGNLLIASVGWNGDLTSEVTANWNVLQSSNGGGGGGTPSQAILTRYAQAGDGTTPPIFFTGAAVPFWGWDILEISGLTGNIAADIISHTQAFGDFFAGSFTTAHQNTTTANQLALLLCCAYNGTANYAVPGGWTAQDNWSSSPNYGAMMTAFIAPATPTDIGNLTINKPAGTGSNFYGSQIILAAAPTPAWTQITIP